MRKTVRCSVALRWTESVIGHGFEQLGVRINWAVAIDKATIGKVIINHGNCKSADDFMAPGPQGSLKFGDTLIKFGTR